LVILISIDRENLFRGLVEANNINSLVYLITAT
jgi:hypothetical protein